MSRQQTIPKDPNAVCSSCGRTGHLAENCFRKIGYPWWWGERPRSNNLKLPNTQQGGSNVPANDRRGLLPSTPKCVDQAHVNQVTFSAPSFTANSAITEADRSGIIGLNDQEWQSLKKMLNERKPDTHERLSGKHFIESWVIDTGASNHMTGSIEFLVEVSVMSPVFIKLPDGRFTRANKQGKVCLGSSLQLSNVFFVDGLQCHLISVSQLTRDRSCIFQISDKLCFVQDRIT